MALMGMGKRVPRGPRGPLGFLAGLIGGLEPSLPEQVVQRLTTAQYGA